MQPRHVPCCGCEAGDEAKALELLHTHITGVRDDLLDHLKTQPQG